MWGIAAWLLWRSKVPGSLRLPHVDTAATFPAAELRRVDSYNHVSSLLWLAGVLVELVVFGIYAWWGPRFARESAAGPVGTGMLLGMLGFGLLWLVDVPFKVVELWWDRRHGVSHESYVTAVLGGWFALGFEFVLLCVALGIVMGLARWIGHRWWILAAPLFVGIVVLDALAVPYLVHTHPAADYPGLSASVATLEREAHVGHVPVRIQDVSTDTTLPNAETEGIGPSRRVVVWSTLLDGRFSNGEIRVVIAHELGHVARNHIWKSVGWEALFLFPETFLISVAVRRRGGMGEPAAVPLAVFAFVVIGLVALPVRNVISRHMESEADWLALQTTHDPADARALFASFVPTALSDPAPPTREYVLLDDHPTVEQRIAMVRAWKSRYAASSDHEP